VSDISLINLHLTANNSVYITCLKIDNNDTFYLKNSCSVLASAAHTLKTVVLWLNCPALKDYTLFSHTCYPSYLGGRGQNNHSSNPAQAKS
jgi:hypothetical protein